jgi:hypothetical protein
MSPFKSFKTSAEAGLVLDLFTKNGIRALVEGEEFAVIPGGFSDEIVLMVDERDLPHALELYEAYFVGEVIPVHDEAPKY